MGVILQISLVTATLVMCYVSLAFNMTDNDYNGCTIYNYNIFCWDDDGVLKVGGPNDRIKNCGTPKGSAFEHHKTTNCCLEEGSMDIACLAEHKNMTCTVGYAWEQYRDFKKVFYYIKMRQPLTIFFRDPKYSTYDRSEIMQYKSEKLTSSRNRHEGYEISCNGSVTRIRRPGSNHSLSVVLGCSIGIPLLVIIIAVIVVVLVCRKRRKQEREYDDQTETNTSHPIPSLPQGDGTITTSSHHRSDNVSSNRDQSTPGQRSTAYNPPTYISLLAPPPPYSEVAGLTQQETEN